MVLSIGWTPISQGRDAQRLEGFPGQMARLSRIVGNVALTSGGSHIYF